MESAKPTSNGSVSLHRGLMLSSGGPHELHAVEDGCLAIGGDGRIVAVGHFAALQSEFPEAYVEDWGPAAILPGLVDLHSHIPQYSAVGMDGYELLPWLERFVYPTEAAFADPEHALAEARRFFAAALANGTTTACLYATIHEEGTRMAFRAAREAGIRAFIGKVMMDRNAPGALLEATDESLAASERLCREWDGAADGRLRYVFSPRFAVSCTPELLKGVGELAAEEGASVQTHLAENQNELQVVAQLFPAASSYADVYAQARILGPRAVMAHCIYLSPRDFDLLAETGTPIAHCPSSNFFLRSGIMDMAMPYERGIVVGLGSDVGAGPTLSMFEEMAQACFASRARMSMEQLAVSRLNDLEDAFAAIPRGQDLHRRVLERLELTNTVHLVEPVHAFYMATLGGAKALHMADAIGSLEPGKWADFTVIDLRIVDPAFGERDRTPEEILSQIVFRTQPRAVLATFVGGRQCAGAAASR